MESGLKAFKNIEQVEQIISKIITEEFVVPVRLMSRELQPDKENENTWTALVCLAAKLFIGELYTDRPMDVILEQRTMAEAEIKIETKKLIMSRMKEVYRKMKLIIGA